MHAVAQTKADGTGPGRKIPDVGSFNRRGDDKQRSRVTFASIIAKAPMRMRRGNIIGAFTRIQSKRANDITLRPANYVAHTKLHKVKIVSADDTTPVVAQHSAQQRLAVISTLALLQGEAEFKIATTRVYGTRSNMAERKRPRPRGGCSQTLLG